MKSGDEICLMIRSYKNESGGGGGSDCGVIY